MLFSQWYKWESHQPEVAESEFPKLQLAHALLPPWLPSSLQCLLAKASPGSGLAYSKAPLRAEGFTVATWKILKLLYRRRCGTTGILLQLMNILVGPNE